MPEPRSLRLRLTALAVTVTSVVATAQQAFRAAHVAPASGLDVRLVHHAADERVVAVAARHDRPEMETWEWDGSAWHQRHPMHAPIHRQAFSLAYDASRRVVVLFGGLVANNTFHADVWEWDGVDWTDRTPTSAPAPVGRYSAAMAFHPRRGRVLVHGGVTLSGNVADQWEWDGVRWTQRPAAPSDPSPRAGHGMAFDAARGVMVLFAGVGLSLPYLDDVHEDDGAGWVRRDPPSRPPGLRGASISHDSSTGRTVVVGGLTHAGPLRDVWEWNGATWQRTAVGWNLGQRSNPGFAFHASTGRHVLHGGTYVTDTWLFDAAARTWTRAPYEAPLSNSSAQAAGTWTGKTLYRSSSETLMFDHATRSWARVATPSPAPMLDVAMTFDVARREAVLVGPNAAQTTETWIWSEASGQWSARSSAGGPPATFHAAIGFDFGRARTVLFGGLVNGTTATAETYEWDGTSWSRRVVAIPPPARYGAALGYDHRAQRLVLFGGCDRPGGLPYGDLWEWDGVTWTQRTQSIPAPAPRQFAALCARFDELVLIGGDDVNGQILGDVWALRGQQWVAMDAGSLPAMTRAVATSDPLENEVVVFGGFCRPTSLGGSSLFTTGIHAHGAPRAAVVPFGGACAGTGGTPLLATRGLPVPGRNDFALDARRLPASQPAAFVFGGAPLLSLLPVGCRGFVLPSVAFGVTSDAGGAASMALPIPLSLDGHDLRLFTQVFALDQSVAGLAATAALELRLGR